MPRSRLSAALYLFLVFASGILVGIVSHRLYTTTTASANTAPRTPEEWRRRYLEQMKTRVGASSEQLAKVSQLLDDTHRKFDELRGREQKVHDQLYQQQVDSIRGLLTDQQKTAFDSWRAERQRQREREKPNQKN